MSLRRADTSHPGRPSLRPAVGAFAMQHIVFFQHSGTRILLKNNVVHWLS